MHSSSVPCQLHAKSVDLGLRALATLHVGNFSQLCLMGASSCLLSRSNPAHGWPYWFRSRGNHLFIKQIPRFRPSTGRYFSTLVGLRSPTIAVIWELQFRQMHLWADTASLAAPPQSSPFSASEGLHPQRVQPSEICQPNDRVIVDHVIGERFWQFPAGCPPLLFRTEQYSFCVRMPFHIWSCRLLCYPPREVPNSLYCQLPSFFPSVNWVFRP